MKTEEKIIQCKFCQSFFVVSLDIDAYEKWKNDEGLIQDLMPDMKLEERELIISQICSDCFDALFGGELDEQ